MMTLNVNTDEVDHALARLRGGLADMSEPMADIGEYLAEAHQQRIQQSQGAPDGTPWAPKSPFSQSRDSRPWIDSGDLVSHGINYQAAPDQVELVISGVQVRTLHYGAAAGAFGATANGRPIPWGNIPARPLAGLSDTNISAITEILVEWAEDLVAGRG